MAIYHCHIQIINRKSGRSSVAASAYRSGSKLQNNLDGQIYDFTRKSGVVYSRIILPDTAPKTYYNRQTLWNAVESSEKRKDAQTAREIEIALPKELNHNQHIHLVKSYIQEHFISQGMIADFALHDKRDGNPHAHIMLTLREVSQNGFAAKVRSWNDRTNAELWREGWARLYNQALEQNKIKDRVDHRSYARQGLALTPTVHLGVRARQLEERGILTERGEWNRHAKRQQEIYRLQQQKSTIVKGQINHLTTLKNNYLDQALAIFDTNDKRHHLQARADTYRRQENCLSAMVKFMDSTAQRKAEITRQLSAPNLTPTQRVILSRRLDQFDRSLSEDVRILHEQYGVKPEQVETLLQDLRQKAASLEQSATHTLKQPQNHRLASQMCPRETSPLSLSPGGQSDFLDEILNQLLEGFLHSLQELANYLGEGFALADLGAYPSEHLSPAQRQHLDLLENSLEQTVTHSLMVNRAPASQTLEPTISRSR